MSIRRHRQQVDTTAQSFTLSVEPVPGIAESGCTTKLFMENFPTLQVIDTQIKISLQAILDGDGNSAIKGVWVCLIYCKILSQGGCIS